MSQTQLFIRNLEKTMESIALYFKEENDPLFQKGYKIGFKLGIQQGIQQSVGKGLHLKAYQIVVSILGKFPEWKDDIVADLSQTTLEFVQEVRKDLAEKEQ